MTQITQIISQAMSKPTEASDRGDSVDRLQLFLDAILCGLLLGLCGLLLGGWTYYAFTGLRPGNLSLATSSNSVAWVIVFAGMRAAVALLAHNRLVRAAWWLSAATVVLTWATPLGSPGLAAWLAREALATVAAVLLVLAGSSITRSIPLRALALALFCAVIPFRYFTIKQWDDITGRTTIMALERQGTRDAQPNKPLPQSPGDS